MSMPYASSRSIATKGHLSSDAVTGAATRVMRAKLDADKAYRLFKRALKNKEKQNNNAEDPISDIEITALRAEKENTQANYEAAKISLEAVRAAPPLS